MYTITWLEVEKLVHYATSDSIKSLSLSSGGFEKCHQYRESDLFDNPRFEKNWSVMYPSEMLLESTNKHVVLLGFCYNRKMMAKERL